MINFAVIRDRSQKRLLDLSRIFITDKHRGGKTEEI